MCGAAYFSSQLFTQLLFPNMNLNARTSRLLVIALLFLGLTGCEPEVEGEGEVIETPALDPTAELANFETQYETAFNDTNWTALGNLWSEDAVLYSPTEHRGRAAIADYFNQQFGATGMQVDVESIEAFGAEDYIFDHGTYTYRSTTSDQTMGPLHYNAVFHRGDDGVWRLHRLYAYEAAAPQAAAGM